MKKEPKFKKDPAYVKEVLKWCNARRKEKGKKPLKKLPKGYPDDARSCPCGKATGLKVYRLSYRDLDAGIFGRITKSVRRFVDAFDAGQLPQYDAAL